MSKMYQLKLCSNNRYYLYKDNELVIDYVDFDKFNKESAEGLIRLLNEYEENLKVINELVSEALSMQTIKTGIFSKILQALYKNNIDEMITLTEELTECSVDNPYKANPKGIRNR